MFELSIVTRDAKGNPIGRKEIVTDNPAKLDEFWLRMRGKPKKRKHKKVDNKKTTKGNKLPTAEQAKKILKDLYKE